MNAMTIVLLAVVAIAAVMGFGMKNNGNNEFTPTGTFPVQFG
jgi:hypothetical protein